MAFARFDDLTPGGEHAFELDGLEAVITADDPGQVRSALRAVDQATRHGRWAAGYVAYEAGPGLDAALATRPRNEDEDLPCLWFGIFRQRIPASPVTPRVLRPAPYHISGWRTAVDQHAHADAIAAIRRHIEDGDTYQVNFTFRLLAAFSGDPYELYRDLVVAQRGPYGAYLDTGRHHIVSASPELFYARAGNRIQVRPMKGTIARGRWPAEDEALAQQLTRSIKDRAENLMIVDLLRNDLGRVAKFGTVRVDELFALERYETLWQLTSRISAELRREVTLEDIFVALFPSGSVTGAPKTRTTEIIADLEPSPRGVYCGAIGYLAPRSAGRPADAAFNVAIRTVTIDTREGTAEYGVGGGITWDSVSAAEYEEARVKAQLLVERRPEFSLVETLRWDRGGGYFLRDEHLVRLADSAEYFGFAFDRVRLDRALDEEVNGAEETLRVRLVLRRDGEVDVTGVALPVAMALEFDASVDPIRFAIDEEPVSAQNVFLFHKTTHRAAYDERLKRHTQADDVLLHNARGEATEFTIGNLAIQLDGTWWTPPIGAGLLGGVFRNALVAQGVLRERTIHRSELAGAQQIAFLNSVRGWRPAVPFEERGEVIAGPFPGV